VSAMKSNPKSRTFLLLLLPLLAAVPMDLSAVESADFSGSLENLVSAFPEPLTSEKLYGVGRQTLRLQGRLEATKSVLMVGTWELSARIFPPDLSETGLLSEAPVTSFRARDLPRRLWPLRDEEVGNMGVYQNLDRLYASIYLPLGDLYIGRQAISLGTAMFVNPLDVFSSTESAVSGESARIGVDALRFRAPLGLMGELDAAYVAGEDMGLEKSVLFTRLQIYLYSTDVTLLAMKYQEDLLLGTGVTRAIGGAGTWFEGALRLPGLLSSGSPEDGDPQLSLSAGAEHSFGPKFYLSGEYHFNSAGVRDPADYSQAPAPTYLRGRHYLSMGAEYRLGPLSPLSTQLIWNMGDPSAILSLSLEHGLGQNLFLTGAAVLGLGEEPEAAAPLIYRSEFGAVFDQIFVAVEYFF